VLLLAHSTYLATAENPILTPALEQHIRQLDLTHMLGGGNLFDEATEKGPARTTTAIAALGCQPLLARVLLSELRCVTLHKKHIETSLATETQSHTSCSGSLCRVLANFWNIMHMHTIEEHINFKRLAGLIILGQVLSTGPTSGQHLGTGMATFSMRSRSANRKEATQIEFMDLFFLLHAISGFYIGKAIQWTNYFPRRS
jgi:hypothetical protein